MEMKGSKVNASVALAGLAFAAVFAVSFAIAPLAIAAPSGSSYPIEIMRVNTAYTVADPAPAVQVGLGVHGNI